MQKVIMKYWKSFCLFFVTISQFEEGVSESMKWPTHLIFAWKKHLPSINYRIIRVALFMPSTLLDFVGKVVSWNHCSRKKYMFYHLCFLFGITQDSSSSVPTKKTFFYLNSLYRNFVTLLWEVQQWKRKWHWVLSFRGRAVFHDIANLFG